VKVKVTEVINQQGVPGFWLRALKNHHLIKTYIKKHDEPILKHLINISGRHFEDRHGYELTFKFTPNEFMENTELKKAYFMVDDHILERTESTEISWKDEMDPTKKKIKKKQKNKKTKAVRVIMKTVDQESFFGFFKSLTMPDPKKLNNMQDDDQEELAVRIDEDFDFGNDIINDVLPEALEIYLGVVDNEFSDLDSNSDEDGEGEGDNDGEGDDNDDDDKKKPTNKDAKGKKSGNQQAAGGKKQDDSNEKPECKQQ